MTTTEQLKELMKKLRSADPDVRLAGLLSMKAVLTTILMWIDKAIEKERSELSGNSTETTEES